MLFYFRKKHDDSSNNNKNSNINNKNSNINNKNNKNNYAIRTNLIKTRTDKTQQNSKCSLCGDKDETIKLGEKKYKTRHDWVAKGIHWKMWHA